MLYKLMQKHVSPYCKLSVYVCVCLSLQNANDRLNIINNMGPVM